MQMNSKWIISLLLPAFAQTVYAGTDSTLVSTPTTTQKQICVSQYFEGVPAAPGAPPWIPPTPENPGKAVSNNPALPTYFGMTPGACVPIGVPGAPPPTNSCQLQCDGATTAVNAAGGGYQVGDQITLAGGASTPCVVQVTSLSNPVTTTVGSVTTTKGGVAGISMVNPGSGSSSGTGSNPVGQAWTTGTGSGANFNVGYTAVPGSCSTGSGGGAGFTGLGAPMIVFGGGNISVQCPSDYPYFTAVEEGIGSSLVWIAPPIWSWGMGNSGTCCSSPTVTTKMTSQWLTPDSDGNCPAGSF
jgi:hypothetical protein